VRRGQSRQRPGWVALVLVACLGPVATPVGCLRRAEPAAEDAIDPSLLAFLSRARAAHHRADLLEADERLEPAVRELSAIVDGPLPRGGPALAEVREVLADTLARRAELSSRLGQHDAATADVDRGLTLAAEVSYFRGHLYEVRGLIEERRAAYLRAEAERLLERADARAAGTTRTTLDQLIAAREAAASRAASASPEEADATRDALAAARQALERVREALLTPDERARVEARRADARTATERALAAFSQAVAIQGQVIEQTLPPHATSGGDAPHP